MTTIQITKERIIKAIQTEPLKAGMWVNQDDPKRDEVINKLYDRVYELQEEDHNARAKKLFEKIYALEAKVGMVKDPCTVCAVGAVFRSVLDKNELLDNLSDLAETVTNGVAYPNWNNIRGLNNKDLREACKNQAIDIVNSGQYMGALSAYFEGLCTTDLRMDKVRARLVTFVKEHFPKHITVDINGFKPAKDIKVVKKK